MDFHVQFLDSRFPREKNTTYFQTNWSFMHTYQWSDAQEDKIGYICTSLLIKDFISHVYPNNKICCLLRIHRLAIEMKTILDHSSLL